MFCKLRTVPLKVKDKVKAELKRLEDSGILTRVLKSDYATATINVLKDNNSISICGDYSCKINKHLKLNQYPLPSIDDIIAEVGDAKVFSKIDLVNAFLQLPLNEKSQAYATMNTSEALLVFVHPLVYFNPLCVRW